MLLSKALTAWRSGQEWGLFDAFAADLVGGGGKLAGFEDAGFVDDAGEFVDDVLAVDVFGAGEVDEGDVGALEEAFDVLGVVAGGFDGGFGGFEVFLVDLDGANWAQSTLITEDEVDDFVFDELVGGVAVLGADFVI